MCQAFSDAGHEVVLAATEASACRDVAAYYGLRGGFDIFLKRIPTLLSGRVSRKLYVRDLLVSLHHRTQLRRFRPDLIYSRLTVGELLLVPSDIPIVYEMHSLGPLAKRGFRQWLFRWLVANKRFGRIIVTTHALATELRAKLPGTEIVVARLSADTPLTVDPEQLLSFKAEHLQGQGFRHHVGYTGYLDTVGLRGTEVICQCAAHMPEAAFHIVGGQPEIVQHWKGYAEQFNAHRNIFFYGHRNPGEMPFFLNCFDVVLAPLQHIPTQEAPTGAGMSPLKIPQYMAYRKAIVASDIPAHREVLDDGRTAVLVAPADIAAWVVAISDLLKAPVKRQMLGDSAYRDYSEGFTAEGRVKTILRGL
jgi:glycosyltransferase involved in cell wall biosynthesis